MQRTAPFCLALAAAAAASMLSAAPALAADLPEPVQKMLVAAANSGDQARIRAVVQVAKETNPGEADEIDRIVGAIAARKAAAEQQRLGSATMFENWSGNGRLGGSYATGNSNARSLSVGLTLARKGLMWRHRVDATLDMIDTDGGDDQQRIFAAYQLDHQFSDRAYSLARLQFDRNLQGGIERRFIESLGFGVRLLQPDPFTLEVEMGPALRQTHYFDHDENRLAGRWASRFKWAFSGNASFANETAVLWEKTGTVTDTATLTSKLIGALSAQLSWSLAWEQEPPEGRKQLDTISRATISYNF